MTGAEAAVKTLKAHGINLVFGIPGVQNLEYFDAFVSEGFEVVLVSHEQGGVFMADAVGRVTGMPGVLAVVPGPGLTNIFTGLGEALLDSAPLVALVPGVRANFKEAFQLHEIDQEGASRSLTSCFFQSATADEVSRVTAQAIQCARSGEPGPVVIEVPYDILQEGTSKLVTEPLPLDTYTPAPADLDRAAKLLLAAKRPGLHVGMGAAWAADLVRELAERLDAPVSTTISGRGVLAEDHDLSVGFGFGAAGTELAEKVFKDVDLVLAVGCKFSEVGSGAYGLKMPKLIHVDAEAGVVGRNFKAEVGIVADARQALTALLERVRPHRELKDDSPLRQKIREAHALRERKLDGLEPWPDSVNPARLYRELRKRAPRDAILTTDSGAHTFWAPFSFDAYLPKTVLSPVDYSSMGYSIPASIGASLAAPGRKVICTVGDGGLLMTGTELATARRLGLPLLVVVFNDRSLGLIKQTQQKIYRRSVAVDTAVVELDQFAAAFGFDYQLIERDADLGPALDQAFAAAGPLLIDARVEYRTQTRHTRGSAMSLVKRTPPGVVLRMAARAAWRSLFD